MSAVRISALLVVFCFLFIAIPCYAVEAVPSYGQTQTVALGTAHEDNANRVLSNLEGLGSGNEIGNASECTQGEAVYSIIANVRHPVIKRGKTVEIEIYLSGYGNPGNNKLMMIWSSPYLIDKYNPGNITYIFDYDINSNTITSGFLDLRPTYRGPIIGNVSGAPCAWLELPPIIFEPAAALIQGNFSCTEPTLIMGETNWNDNPPILVQLKTRSDSQSGDYQVNFTFTYGNETNPKQAYQGVQFHVLSGWQQFEEHWQARAIVVGLFVAVVALIFTAMASTWQMRRWCKGTEDGKGKSDDGKGKGKVKGSGKSGGHK